MAIEKIERDVNLAYYYPNTVSPSKEFKALADIENTELHNLWKVNWKLFLNTFVYDIDTDGAERWEDMLKIIPPAGASRCARRLGRLAKLNKSAPYTEKSLQIMLDGVFGAGLIDVSVIYDKYALYLDLETNLLLSQSDYIRRFVREIIPANMGIFVSNTKKVVSNIYFGGALKVAKIISIAANNNLDGVDLSLLENHAGRVSILKYMEV